MAKREQMYRLMYIRDYLKTKSIGASYEEIRNFLEEKYHKDSFGGELAFSEKTFKRDRQLLEDLFGIEIKFKRSSMTYQIIEDGLSDSSQNIFDNLILVNAYKQTADQSNIILFEKRQASGLNNLDGIVHCIKNRKVLSCKYTKHWEGISKKRVLEPYAVKEFRNRWYLLANEDDGKEFLLKTFGLDRITDLEIHSKTFNKKDVCINDLFKNSFGIISTIDEEPQKIILSFDPEQGQYVKSLPLHHSQTVLEDNEEVYKIGLTLVPTYDFYQELLTHTQRLIAIEPKEVKTEFVRILNKGLKNFNKSK